MFWGAPQVVYTDQLPTYADPILDRLDPQRFIQYRLYRDSTQYLGGKHVRRPLSPFVEIYRRCTALWVKVMVNAGPEQACLLGLRLLCLLLAFSACACTACPLSCSATRLQQVTPAVQVRNLNYLNRDLGKVLLITANADAYHLQPENAIKARPLSSLLAAHAGAHAGVSLTGPVAWRQGVLGDKPRPDARFPISLKRVSSSWVHT